MADSDTAATVAVISEYHSIAMSEVNLADPENDKKLSHLGTKIELLLNPSEESSQRLLRVKNKIKNTKDIDERNAFDPELVSAAQAILKTEWDRIKADLQP
jgi:hypothetical protein